MEKNKTLFGYRNEDWYQLKSSNLDKVTYDYVTMDLLILFHNGSCYAYREVPEDIFEGLKNSDSAGKYLNKVIIPNFKCNKL